MLKEASRIGMKGTGCKERKGGIVSERYEESTRRKSRSYLLTTTLRDGEEVGNIGRSEDLVLGFRVLREEFAEESAGVVKLFVRLEGRDLCSRVVDV